VPVKPFPCRLHVLLARESRRAVVIRRGPSRTVCTLLWDRDTDAVSPGQWLRGRIYERRCDLSPDGKYLLYFAMNGRWDSATKGSYSAISHAPYLKAVGLWAKGDCWNGGGLFVNNREFWLNEGCGHEVLQAMSGLRQVVKFPWGGNYGGECPGVYYRRLQRDEWILNGERGDAVIFEKRINDHWTLRKLAHGTICAPPGKGCYYDEHELANPRTGAVLPFPGWEFAEVDGSRLVWAEAGRLSTARVARTGLVKVTQIHDFNDMTFTPIKAPY
jgi:hypothetical protein